jgi:hypothetical protein
MLADTPTCTGVVVLLAKFIEEAMSIVGFPPAPLPLVPAMFGDPAVSVRFAVTPGDVSTTSPLEPGSLRPKPEPPHISVPEEFIQQIPPPLLAYTLR